MPTSSTYADWSTIAPITIANAPGVADYPVRVNLTYASPMATDFSDIRFVDASDNALSYWIESYVSSTSAVVWVKVAASTTAIWMLYGNAGATSESNGGGCVHVCIMDTNTSRRKPVLRLRAR